MDRAERALVAGLEAGVRQLCKEFGAPQSDRVHRAMAAAAAVFANMPEPPAAIDWQARAQRAESIVRQVFTWAEAALDKVLNDPVRARLVHISDACQPVVGAHPVGEHENESRNQQGDAWVTLMNRLCEVAEQFGISHLRHETGVAFALRIVDELAKASGAAAQAAMRELGAQGYTFNVPLGVWQPRMVPGVYGSQREADTRPPSDDGLVKWTGADGKAHAAPPEELDRAYAALDEKRKAEAWITHGGFDSKLDAPAVAAKLHEGANFLNSLTGWSGAGVFSPEAIADCMRHAANLISEKSAWVTLEELKPKYAEAGPLLELDALLSKLVLAVKEQDATGCVAEDELGAEQVKAIQQLVRRIAIVVPAVPALNERDAHDAWNNCFHKCAPEVPYNWWLIVWRKALEWAANKAGTASPQAAMLQWRDKWDAGHVMTPEKATEVLRQLYDAWPGGLEEIESAVRTKTPAILAGGIELAGDPSSIETLAACLGDDSALLRSLENPAFGAEDVADNMDLAATLLLQVERLLNDIGVVREGDKTFLTLVDENDPAKPEPGASNKWRVACWSYDSPHALSVVAWMMRKQRALHGIADPEAGAPSVEAAEEQPVDDMAALRSEVGAEMMAVVASGKPHDWSAEPWRDWDGRDVANSMRVGWPQCPVAPNTAIEVRFRDGTTQEVYEPQQLRWAWSRPYLARADIVAWRLSEPLPF